MLQPDTSSSASSFHLPAYPPCPPSSFRSGLCMTIPHSPPYNNYPNTSYHSHFRSYPFRTREPSLSLCWSSSFHKQQLVQVQKHQAAARGWPKGSKNKPRDPSAPSQQKKTPAKKHSASSNTQDITPAPKHAIYSNDDNKTLMEVFLDQKAEGRQTSNGNWKTPALTAAVKALAASEATSGGAPKTASSIRDHWKELKADENQCVLASDEQWDTLIEAEPQFASYRGKSFPIYEEMDELLNGALATGSHAFHAGKVTSDESDSNSDSGNEADVNPDTSFEDISASQVTPGPAIPH
ncbi:hypothetical protein K435DRAFT_851512 [Dendrothele bispora CBS 962.96]|uniref:Myb/SANT-like domain-containing protein n=1 Tax=Dendrothele bispora (strain CBS 962.96) TaxID=1314807 RepID=A0A4S8MN70_DENBC|nr:hypothetical protein K435DRAFT_851512 [Dendrothele bispora CBS 962.96]